MEKTFKDYLLEAETTESGLRYHTGVEKHGKEYMDKAAEAGRKGASQQELGALKDKYSKAEKNKKTPEGSLSEGNDAIIFKGKEIDTDTIEYDMQDFSDMVFELEIGIKYTDGTEVSDEDMDDLMYNDQMMDWVAADYNDRQMDQADMYRDMQRDAGMESTELDRIKELAGASIDETYDDDDAFYEAYGEMWYNEDDIMDEAEYQGRKVKLGKPMQGDVKKFKVYVKDPKTGNTKKVNFGHGGSSVKGKAMSIKKSNPARRKSFRARHNCDNPGPRTKARYWSCRKW
jgi:dGTP triphosphohydrolase